MPKITELPSAHSGENTKNWYSDPKQPCPYCKELISAQSKIIKDDKPFYFWHCFNCLQSWDTDTIRMEMAKVEIDFFTQIKYNIDNFRIKI
jgi:transcription elongation factor Elf1